LRPSLEPLEHQNLKGIHAWPETERPRERLIRYGVESLADAELVAILLRNGIKGKDALELSRELIAHFGGLRGLTSAKWKELKSIKGLGVAKISTLIAAAEIARRGLREEIFHNKIVKDPESVADYLRSSLRDQKKEIFKVIFLNKGNEILDEQDLFKGTIDETLVHPREVLKAALERHATGIILVHNHPSGRIEPSREDIRMTERIKAACELVSIKVLDHLIVGDNQLFSFREKGLIE
jgi:DNA repair protein RadC